MQIYLDHSATTPPCAEAIAAMQAVLTQQWGNPLACMSGDNAQQPYLNKLDCR
jgi:cysteine sulfinate desulfinase/cysteine desulfurase-like protein